jgi:uncharacterized membrane protein YphA (DoxX/SURF4 family)
MNSLDRIMEFLLAGVFMWDGLARIFSYSREAKESETSDLSGLIGQPDGSAAAIGLFEVMAALALVAPVGPWPAAARVLLAASGLALLMIAASVYRVRRQQSAVPTVALFLMALFVIVGRAI